MRRSVSSHNTHQKNAIFEKHYVLNQTNISSVNLCNGFRGYVTKRVKSKFNHLTQTFRTIQMGINTFKTQRDGKFNMTSIGTLFYILGVLRVQHFRYCTSHSTVCGYNQPLPLVIPRASGRERVYTHPLKGISSQLGLVKRRHFRTNFSDTKFGYIGICTLMLIT